MVIGFWRHGSWVCHTNKCMIQIGSSKNAMNIQETNPAQRDEWTIPKLGPNSLHWFCHTQSGHDPVGRPKTLFLSQVTGESRSKPFLSLRSDKKPCITMHHQHERTLLTKNGFSKGTCASTIVYAGDQRRDWAVIQMKHSLWPNDSQASIPGPQVSHVIPLRMKNAPWGQWHGVEGSMPSRFQN